MELLDEPQPTPVVIPTGPVTLDFRQAIEKSLADIIPEGKQGALIGVASTDGIVLGVAHKVNNSWTVGADVQKKWGGDLSGRVMVVGTW